MRPQEGSELIERMRAIEIQKERAQCKLKAFFLVIFIALLIAISVMTFHI